MDSPDWEHLATFVGVARAGSLTGGARELGISQPTAGRHVEALEEALGATLFVRHSRGLALTDAGAALFAGADDVARRIDGLLRVAGDDTREIAGSVRISAAEPVGGHAITPALRALRTEHPALRFEVVIDDSAANLSQREADVAIRMFRPTQQDLVAKRIGEVELGLFATREYLDRHGAPSAVDASGGHTLVGSDRDAAWHRAIDALGLSPRDFAYRCDSLLAQYRAVLDSVGIGVMHAPLAARHPELTWVLPELRLPSLEMWLVMHRDLRGNLAVRSVFDQLTETLTAYVQTPGPAPYC